MRKVFVVIPTRSFAVTHTLLNSLDAFLMKYAKDRKMNFERIERKKNAKNAGFDKFKKDCTLCFKNANTSEHSTIVIIHGNNVTPAQRKQWYTELMKKSNNPSHYSITFCDMVPKEEIKFQCLLHRSRRSTNETSDDVQTMKENLDLYVAPNPSDFPGFDVDTIRMNVNEIMAKSRKYHHVYEFPSATLGRIRARLDSIAFPIETSKKIQDRLDSITGDRRKAVKVGNRPNHGKKLSTPTGEERVVQPNVYSDPSYTALGGWERNYDEASSDDFFRDYTQLGWDNDDLTPWGSTYQDSDSRFYDKIGWEPGIKLDEIEAYERIPSNIFAEDICDNVLKEMRSSE
jgi:hypothetical protein